MQEQEVARKLELCVGSFEKGMLYEPDDIFLKKHGGKDQNRPGCLQVHGQPRLRMDLVGRHPGGQVRVLFSGRNSMIGSGMHGVFSELVRLRSENGRPS